ncbi:MAG: serine/threonine-protein kinase [Sandaracinaceae bacterium]
MNTTRTPPSPRIGGAGSEVEELEFLRGRVARHLGLLAGLSLGFYAFRVVLLLASRLPSEVLASHMNSHLAAAGFLLLGWAFNSARSRSRRAIQVSELGALFSACVAYGWMATAIPLIGRPDFVLLMIFTSLLLSRAVMIPDSWRGTTLVGVVLGAELVGSVASIYRDVPPELQRLFEAEPTAGDLSWSIAVVAGVLPWWVMFVILAASTSAVIYGLRSEMREVRQLGQYRLVRKIGEGGMGVVFEATHAMLRRPTAVKVLQPERIGEMSLRRFEREVQATAQLRHPNTVTVFDYGRTPDGLFYYAMELIDGATLRQVVELVGPLPAGRVVHLLTQAAGALAEAHEAGMVHRDIKPENLLLTTEGGLADVVKVVDFGLVRRVDSTALGSVDVSQDGALLGTPLYMAPEAIQGHPADARTDLYSLGAVAYFLLTGEPLFSGRTVVEVCSQHLSETPAPPSARLGEAIPEALESLVLQLLEKDPAARPESAHDVQRALESMEITTWSREDARGWWREYGPDLAPTSTGGAALTDTQALAVDLGRRT